MKERHYQMIVWIIVYVCCSAIGLGVIKLGVNQGVGATIEGSVLGLKVSLILLVGVLIYTMSFIISLFIMSRCDLSYFYPISSGLIYMAVVLFSFLFLNERITFQEMVGMVVIFVGIILMNIGKN